MTEELDRAIERIMGVSIEAMGGDNLAVLLCSHFDDPDDGSDMDDTGWSETATNAYEEIKREIEGLFVPVRAELAKRDATIIQLGENAAKAAEEYAEEVARLRKALDQIAQRDGDGFHMHTPQAMEFLARAALTEPTDG